MLETLATLDLPLIWGGLIAFGVFMYVFMDGFDLGIGILFQSVPTEQDRDVMMNAVAPVWDGNETWMVLGGAGLLAAFPLAYSVVLSALYLPLIVMLIALIFRGVAFEFRSKSRDHKFFWDQAFNSGSFVATFAQGVVLGAFIQGFPVAERQFVGTAFDWLTPFAIFCGVALTAGYALLGATWLILKTSGALQDWARRTALWLLLAVAVCVGMVSFWTPFLHTGIADRWFSWPNIAWLAPVPLLTAAVIYGLARAIRSGRELAPFLLTILLFLLNFGGLGISLWPHVVPPEITLWQAASPPETQAFALIGMVVLVPVILAYTVYTYYVFRGKARWEDGYH